MSDMENPNWGTSLRGVQGRNPGDYSGRIARNSGYQTPQMKGSFQAPEIDKSADWMDPEKYSNLRFRSDRSTFTPKSMKHGHELMAGKGRQTFTANMNPMGWTESEPVV